MVSKKEVKRLRKEAQTIFSNLGEIEEKLREARHEKGDHWEKGELQLSLESPKGEEIKVELDLDKSASENAETRYEKVKDMEDELKRKKKVEGELVDAPPTPLTFMILDHLKLVKGDYPRSISKNLDADKDRIVDLCQKMEERGLLDRIPSGMIKRKKVKLKRSLETHQHHTYYQLSENGDHLLRFLETEDGKKSFLIKMDNARKIAKRLWKGGPDYFRNTSEDLDINLKKTRQIYKAMMIAGIVETYDGSIIKGRERKLKPKKETHRKHTYYITTDKAELILRELD